MARGEHPDAPGAHPGRPLRGRRGLSRVGRARAARLAARHTSFARPFVERAALPLPALLPLPAVPRPPQSPVMAGAGGAALHLADAIAGRYDPGRVTSFHGQPDRLYGVPDLDAGVIGPEHAEAPDDTWDAVIVGGAAQQSAASGIFGPSPVAPAPAIPALPLTAAGAALAAGHASDAPPADRETTIAQPFEQDLADQAMHVAIPEAGVAPAEDVSARQPLHAGIDAASPPPVESPAPATSDGADEPGEEVVTAARHDVQHPPPTRTAALEAQASVAPPDAVAQHEAELLEAETDWRDSTEALPSADLHAGPPAAGSAREQLTSMPGAAPPLAGPRDAVDVADGAAWLPARTLPAAPQPGGPAPFAHAIMETWQRAPTVALPRATPAAGGEDVLDAGARDRVGAAGAAEVSVPRDGGLEAQATALERAALGLVEAQPGVGNDAAALAATILAALQVTPRAGSQMPLLALPPAPSEQVAARALPEAARASSLTAPPLDAAQRDAGPITRLLDRDGGGAEEGGAPGRRADLDAFTPPGPSGTDTWYAASPRAARVLGAQEPPMAHAEVMSATTEPAVPIVPSAMGVEAPDMAAAVSASHEPLPDEFARAADLDLDSAAGAAAEHPPAPGAVDLYDVSGRVTAATEDVPESRMPAAPTSGAEHQAAVALPAAAAQAQDAEELTAHRQMRIRAVTGQDERDVQPTSIGEATLSSAGPDRVLRAPIGYPPPRIVQSGALSVAGGTPAEELRPAPATSPTALTTVAAPLSLLTGLTAGGRWTVAASPSGASPTTSADAAADEGGWAPPVVGGVGTDAAATRSSLPGVAARAADQGAIAQPPARIDRLDTSWAETMPEVPRRGGGYEPLVAAPGALQLADSLMRPSIAPSANITASPEGAGPDTAVPAGLAVAGARADAEAWSAPVDRRTVAPERMAIAAHPPPWTSATDSSDLDVQPSALAAPFTGITVDQDGEPAAQHQRAHTMDHPSPDTAALGSVVAEAEPDGEWVAAPEPAAPIADGDVTGMETPAMQSVDDLASLLQRRQTAGAPSSAMAETGEDVASGSDTRLWPGPSRIHEPDAAGVAASDLSPLMSARSPGARRAAHDRDEYGPALVDWADQPGARRALPAAFDLSSSDGVSGGPGDLRVSVAQPTAAQSFASELLGAAEQHATMGGAVAVPVVDGEIGALDAAPERAESPPDLAPPPLTRVASGLGGSLADTLDMARDLGRRGQSDGARQARAGRSESLQEMPPMEDVAAAGWFWDDDTSRGRAGVHAGQPDARIDDDRIERLLEQMGSRLDRLEDDAARGVPEPPGIAPAPPGGAEMPPAPVQQEVAQQAATTQHSSWPQPGERDIDDLVDLVLTRVRRQLLLDHERAGGYLSPLLR